MTSHLGLPYSCQKGCAIPVLSSNCCFTWDSSCSSPKVHPSMDFENPSLGVSKSSIKSISTSLILEVKFCWDRLQWVASNLSLLRVAKTFEVPATARIRSTCLEDQPITWVWDTAQLMLMLVSHEICATVCGCSWVESLFCEATCNRYWSDFSVPDLVKLGGRVCSWSGIVEPWSCQHGAPLSSEVNQNVRVGKKKQ